MICSACNTDGPDDDLFCESCGAQLQVGGVRAEQQGGAVCSCGAAAGELDEDGFCLACGKRVRRPASDHVEESISAEFAAVSDRGLRHDRNEDRFALVHVDGRFGVVVCDGVSSTSHSEVASAIVSACAARELSNALTKDEDFCAETVLREAIRTAAGALQAQTGTGSGDGSPSTTVVAALVDEKDITVGWAGDSRAYWIGAAGATALTRDHSWLNETLASGDIGVEAARLAPQSHAITRWLGADAESAGEPEVVSVPRLADGTLLLCSDGLWNYADEPDSLSKVVREAAAEDGEAVTIARRLVCFANEQGGWDNVTVAVLHLPRPSSKETTSEESEQNGDLERREDTGESRHGGSVQG